MNDLLAEPITVQILGREYKLRCRPEERQLLIAAVQRLDAEMRAVRTAGKASGSDRIAIMAALSIIHELMQLQAQYSELQKRLNRQIVELNELVDKVLTQEEATPSEIFKLV